MAEIHRPSRTQAIKFFFGMLFFAIAVIAWVFFLNKGTVVVVGAEGEYTMRVGSKDYTCESVCSLKLPSRLYTAVLRKDGFYEEKKEVAVRRWRTSEINVSFRFIPSVKLIGEIILPVDSAPLRPPFLGMKKLENFPRDAKKVVFSPIGNSALVFLGKELYVYQIGEKSEGKYSAFGGYRIEKISSPFEPAWLYGSLVFLENTDGKQILKHYSPFEDDNDDLFSLVTFERPFENAILFGETHNEAKILIQEMHNGKFSYYLVDRYKKSRKKLEISSNARNPHWTAYNNIIFEEGEGSEKKIFAFDTESLAPISLPAFDTENVHEKESGIFVFISQEKPGDNSADLNKSIAEAVEEAKKETFAPEKNVDSLYIVELDTKKNESKVLGEVPLGKGEHITRLTPDPNGKKWYFEKGGKLFELVLEP